MKKISLPFIIVSLVCSGMLYSQTSWRQMMEDPAVNFYSVQQNFEQYWADSTKAVYVEVPNSNAVSKWANSNHAPMVMKKKLPGWKAFKRWEDFMRPRVYPTGDRSVMINAMNDYYQNFYSSTGNQNRQMGGGGTPGLLAANWSIIGPTTSIPSGGGAGRVNFVRFDPANTNILWVGSPGGGLWNSTNGGTSWTTNTDNLAVLGCSDLAIHPSNNQIMYLATGDGDASDTYSVGVLKSTNGGSTWGTTGLNWLVTNGRTISRLLINPVNPNTLFAATSNGVYRTINAGANWTQIASAAANIKDIEYKPGDTTVVYAVSTTRFYKSINGGVNFTVITSGLPATTAVSRLAIAVTPANAAYVYVLAALATDDGFQGLYRSTDNGTTFTTRATTPNLLGWSSTGSDSGGQGWYDLAVAASPTNADVVIVGGVNIWRSTNGGTNWTINAHWTGSGAPYVHADIHALEFIPGNGTTYFAGCDGGIFRTTTSGSSWSDLSNGLQIAQAYRIGLSATNPNLLLTGWQDNGTNRWSGTAAWTRPLGGDGMEAAIDWSNANVQYGELYYGEINRTTTGGNLTTTIVQSGGTGVNADGDWVTPYIMNPQRASTLIVGKAQAYRSVNRGNSWSALGNVSGGSGNLIALAYAPTDSNYIYMAKMNRFFASTNNGTSFTDRTGTLPVASASITYIAVASNNPAHVWVTFSGYSAANKVWYSADAGVTWSNYSTGLPNLPANCIVYQNAATNDALYVGTDVGVYFRDNAAASWTAYNTGLPNVIVRELEIQYGVSKLRAATFGRGIWQSDLATPGVSAPVADFSANRLNICIGDCINFTDLSTSSPTSWAWSFPGAATTGSTAQNPTGICYNAAGTYNVTLTATNANGNNTITKTAYINVSGTTVLPLVEGFQGTYLPAGWAQSNPDLDNTWAQNTTSGGFGTSSSSVMMDNYSPATTIAGTIDELTTPKYSFTGLSSAQMTFDVAYARYNATYKDSLIVYVSTDCGVSWAQVYSKGGFTGLQTAPDNSTSMFVPTSTQWRTETVNMNPYVGQSNVSVKFTNRSGWGQTLYLDNINITGTGSVAASVSISSSDTDNVICAGSLVTFTAAPTNGGTTPAYQWQVNGSNVGTNSPTYTTTALTNGQIVTVIMTSNMPGVTGSPATSNAITMTVNAIPATPTVTTSSPDCTGQTISLNTSAVTGATYAWTGPATFTSSVQNPTRPSATAAMAGTYSVTVTVNGCTSAAGTAAVVINTTPATPTATSNSPVCTGNTINLSTPTVAGATYAWTGPSAFTSAVQNPTRTGATTAMAGTYSLTVTTNGCTSAAGTVAVVVNTTPATPVASSNSPVCTGNTINLSTPTVAGATYAWTGPSSFTSAVQNPTRTGATTAMAGTYSVTVTTNGCTSAAGTAAVVINTTPATPTASSNSPVCSGNTINLSTPTVAGATYAWTGPSAFTSAVQNPTRTGATTAMTGTYSVTVTTNGCTSAVGIIAVVVNTTPAVPTITSNSPVCAGSSLNLSTSSVAGATYAWTGPLSFNSTAQNPVIAGATTAMSGTYNLIVTANGCSSPTGTASVVVNATPASPVPMINGSATPAAICAGGTITLTANTIAGASYSWSGPNGYTAAVRNPPALTNATAAMAGTYSLTVTVNGCTSTPATVSIGVTPVPVTPSASSNTPVCTGASINLTSPLVSGATYSWSGPSTFTSSVQNPTRPTATTAMAGTYSVTVTVNGCTSAAGTATVVINTTPATPTASSNSPVCTGNTINLSTPAVAGATYAWTGPSAFTSAVQNPTRTGATTAMAGTYSITVTTNGCTSAGGTAMVAISNGPTAQAITTSPTACGASTGTITLGTTTGGTGPYMYSVNGSSLTLTTTYSGLATGTYPVTVQDANGCVFTTSATITNSSGPTAQVVNTSNSTCGASNGTITFGSTTGGTGPYMYSVNGSSFTTSTSYTGLAAGSYSIVVQDAGGCMFTTSANVVNTPGPSAQAISTVNSTCGNSNGAVNIGATTGGTPAYTYSFDGSAFSALTSYTGLSAGTHTVVVNDANGCSYTVNAVVMDSPGPTAQQTTTTNSTCGGSDGTITIGATTGGTAPYSYSVNGSASTTATNYSGFAAGTYPVVVTDANGCTFSTSATISNTGTVPSTPTISQVGLDLTSSSSTGNQWYLDGVAIPGATGQMYTALVNGTYTVVITTGGCSSAPSSAVVITSVGISDLSNPNGLLIYPNPNDGNFNIRFHSALATDYTVEIVNSLGQLIFKDELKNFSGEYNKKMSVVEYGQGIYTISLTNSKIETVKKIVVY